MAVALQVNPVFPQARHIARAADCLRRDGLIIYPTDTTYGLGADLYNKKGVEKIYSLKPHKKKEALSFICHDLKDISRYAYVSDAAYRVMRELLPGPFTFILNATKEVPRLVKTNKKTVGIRVPDNAVCQALIRELGNPIIGTTAMSREREYFDDPDEIKKELGHAVDYILDGGVIPFEPSTIIDFSIGDEPVILRQGKGVIASFG